MRGDTENRGPLYTSRSFALLSCAVEIVPLRKATGKTVKKEFQGTISCRYGAPKVLVTKNGTVLVNKLLVQVTEEYEILHMTLSPYHAQANPVERANRTFKQIIIAYLDSDHRFWDKNLP